MHGVELDAIATRIHMASMPHRAMALAWLVAAGALGSGGCAGTVNDKQMSAEQVNLADADRRLQGTWVLASVQPAVPLEPALEALLSPQIGALHVTFEKGIMRTQGVGIDMQRSYQVVQAWGDYVAIMLSDAQGNSTQLEGKFDSNDRVTFRSLTSPWQATGSIRRPR